MADSHPLDRSRFRGLDISSLRHATQRDLADRAREARDTALLLAEHNRRCSFCVANKLTIPPLPMVPMVPLDELVPYLAPEEAFELLEAEHIAGRLAQVPTHPLERIFNERYGNLKPMTQMERAVWIADGLVLHYECLASVCDSIYNRLVAVLHATVDVKSPLAESGFVRADTQKITKKKQPRCKWARKLIEWIDETGGTPGEVGEVNTAFFEKYKGKLGATEADQVREFENVKRTVRRYFKD